MPTYPDSGHIDGSYNRPDIPFKSLSPDIDPIRSRPSHTIDGVSVDELLAAKRTADHRAWLLNEAKKSLVTQFSKQAMANTYWGLGYATGFTGGGIAGAFGGYLAMTVAGGALEQITGIPVTDAINSASPEFARILTELGRVVGDGLSFLTTPLPVELAEKTQHYLASFQSQVFATVTGVKLATFTGNKVGGMWYGSGDRLGEVVGAKIAAPLVSLHERIPFRLPQLSLPFRKSHPGG